MNFLLVMLAGCVLGVGLWLGILAVRGIGVLPAPARLVPKGVPAHRAVAWLAASMLAGLVVGMVTGWPVAGLAAFVGLWAGPAALGGGKARRSESEVGEAVAGWAEMIRDTMAGAAGLEESLIQTAHVAPAVIRPELAAFAERVRHQPLDVALARLAADLDHRSADLLVAALAAAARLHARELGALLARLADAIRGDVRVRERVEVGRARIRTSARIAVATTVGTVIFLYLFAGQLLEPYDTVAGQLWLAVVVGVFFGAGWMLRYYSRLETPGRFTLRTTRQPVEVQQ